MKKAEMEHDHAQYFHFLAEARACIQSGKYCDAIERAREAIPFMDGMIQFEKRYGGGVLNSIEALDIILNYAPALFDRDSFSEFASLLKSTQRIDRETERDYAAAFREAQERMWDAHTLWSILEKSDVITEPEYLRHFAGTSGRASAVRDRWEEMDVVTRARRDTTDYFSLATRMGEVVPGKCTACGRVSKAPKAALLGLPKCPACKLEVEFVILSDVAADSKG